jgi:uncharacterized protein (TIGR02996 family)
LLVYVDVARMPVRQVGATWAIGRDEVGAAVDRLDATSVLFVITVEGERALLVARLDGVAPGDATIVDRDITHLLPRLGCAGVDAVAMWANVPRVLPPSDVDVLSYLPSPAQPVALPPPQPPIVRDAVADGLRAAIYGDLASDAARMVFADYLQQRGEPWGELIALQLARRGTDLPVHPREQELLSLCASTAAGPLAPYLRDDLRLRRGFLAACATDGVPASLHDDPTWTTVEDVETSDVALLRSPRLVSLRRVRVPGDALAELAETEHELPIEIAVGPSTWDGELGIAFADPARWDAVLDVGALSRLRALGIANQDLPASWIDCFLASRLGRQLLHLDVFVTDPAQAPAWLRVFDAGVLRLLTVRMLLFVGDSPVADAHQARPVVQGQLAMVCIGVQRQLDARRFVVQVSEPCTGGAIGQVLQLVRGLRANAREIELNDLGKPRRVRDRQRGLFAALRHEISRVLPIVGAALAP